MEGAASDPVVIGNSQVGSKEWRSLERRPGNTWKVYPQTEESRTGCASSSVQRTVKPFMLTAASGPSISTTWGRDKNSVTGGAAAPRYTCYEDCSDRVNARDGGYYQMAFLTPYNGARARDTAVLNLFPAQEAGYCAVEDLVVPIHQSRGGCSIKSRTYALVVRPWTKQTTGTQAGPVTEVSRGRRASSRGGVKAGKRPRNRMWNDASAGSERCSWVWPSVMGIGAPVGFERGPWVFARVLFALRGSLDKLILYLCPAGPRREVDGSQRDPGWWSSIQEGGAGSMVGRWVVGGGKMGGWAGGGGLAHECLQA